MGGMSHDGRPRWGSGRAEHRYSLDSEGIEAVARFIAHGWSESDSARVRAVGRIRTEQREAALTQERAPLQLELEGGRELVAVP